MLCASFIIAFKSPIQNAAAQDTQFVVDTGFRAQKDGFSFQNYGNKQGYSNLTPNDMRRLFGDVACDRIDGDNCILSAAGTEWMTNVNNYLAGGHCDGFATLSYLFYLQQLNASDFGADRTIDLKIADNTKLQREIAYWWSTQTIAPTKGARRQNFQALPKPSDVIKKFIDDVNSKAETYTLYIAQPDWSHAHEITPYAVQDKGNGLYWLMVYDNNYPNVERYVVVDTNAETWSYSTAANPADTASAYNGTADPMTMTLVPNSTRFGTQPCPFCQDQSSKANGLAAPAPQYNEIWLTDTESATSTIHLLITDSQGNKLGYDNGKLVNQIPGADFDALPTDNLWEDDVEPLYRIPVGIKFTVTIDASKLTTAETAGVAMTGPGYDLAVDNIKLQPGESDTLTFSPDGKTLTYKPSGSESPDFSIGTKHADSDYDFDIKGFEVDKGATVNIGLDYDKGQLNLHTEGNTNPSVYAFAITRNTSKETQSYSHDNISLNPGGTIYLDFGKWDGKGDLTVEIDSNNDQTVDQTINEPNQK
jgi:hypothetical protein